MLVPPPVSGEQFGVFSRAQAIEDGWSASALARAVARGRLARLRPGAFIDALLLEGDRPEDRRRHTVMTAVATWLTTGGAVLSHLSAAVLHDLPTLDVPSRACLTVRPRYTGDTTGVHLHRCRLSDGDVRLAGRVPFTSPTQTVLDVAREHGIEQAVVVGDAALRRARTTMSRLIGQVADRAAWPGVGRARRVLALLDGRAESPLESLSRVRLGGRVPPFDLQPEIRADGRFVGRPDFYWEGGVVGEADGMDKYESSSVLRREKRRQESLERAGLVVVRWTWADLDDVDRLARRIMAALRRAPAGPDRRWVARPTVCPGMVR